MPTFVHDAGFEIVGIEQNFKLQNARVIKPDVVVGSRRDKHIVLVETKSGANTKPRQLESYASVSDKDASRICGYEVTVRDCTVIGKEEHSSRLQIGLENGQYDFPLLSVMAAGIRLDYSEFKSTELTQGFRYTEINWTALPSRILLNSASEDVEIGESLVNVLLNRLLQQPETREMSLVEVCEEIWGQEYWSYFGTEEQKNLRDRLKVLLYRAGNEFLDEIMSYQDGTVTFRDDFQSKRNFLDRQSEKASEFLNCISEAGWADELAKKQKRRAKQKKTREANRKKKAEEQAAARKKKIDEGAVQGQLFDPDDDASSFSELLTKNQDYLP